MTARRVFVSGLVQGVGFRAATVRQASLFKNIRGFVRNLPDGRVEAVFCGESNDVLALVAWCRRGPLGARVDSLQVVEETPDVSLDTFTVI